MVGLRPRRFTTRIAVQRLNVSFRRLRTWNAYWCCRFRSRPAARSGPVARALRGSSGCPSAGPPPSWRFMGRPEAASRRVPVTTADSLRPCSRGVAGTRRTPAGAGPGFGFSKRPNGWTQRAGQPNGANKSSRRSNLGCPEGGSFYSDGPVGLKSPF
jgi:hypothetical protein